MNSHTKLIRIVCLFLVITPILLMVSSTRLSAQENFNVVVSMAKGDLNRDLLADSVVVTQDTIADTSPYRLEIYFAKKGGGYHLNIQTDKAINEQSPNGKDGYRDGYGFSKVTIKRGVIELQCQLIRGYFMHKFRYQNGNFELIGYSYRTMNPLGVSFADFNLSTGVYLGTEEYDDPEQKTTKNREIIKVRPLPKLQDFVPYSNDLY
ncbi:hypothetical protein SAMN05421820_101414 [Pedobacter steynii]|uniref:Uncharacterized protein n=1 Tax=Pedobacter steynii TaxID=430522 RepID=A0A1G9JYL0_9SPHI|nr:hypothetical protein [Pedobacter steynii]NQX38395.1 hypothetical protein [Pedobacter steynii]SDL42629.1 hypothetical protein SAMN05421820_101414 [Pedobacter steynii]